MMRIRFAVVGIVLSAIILAAGCGGTGGTRGTALTDSAATRAGMSGAIFTTDSVGDVNVNIFSSKEDVYLNGGPAHEGAAGLPDGQYYGRVATPSGDVLGLTDGAVIQVTGGEFAMVYRLWDILFVTNPDGTFVLDGGGNKIPGFADSSNHEYKAWASQDSAFPPSGSKTDNFRVVEENEPQSGELKVNKFYDANANGVNDDSQPITGWMVNIKDDLNWDRFTPVDIVLSPDDYIVSEYKPVETCWMPTTPTSVTVTLAAGDVDTVEFGNLCLGPGGGHTLGFWSNKNGASQVGSDDLAMLVGLNLRNYDGSNFDPSSYTSFRTWLLSGNAVNMAYMLSVQLAAMELNVFNGLVNGNSIIYAPGTTSANALGFATVSAVMAEANAELAAHGTALAGDGWRGYQETLKNALDNANNNKTFVQPTPCPFTFAIPPATY